jgi:hypothetical protein
MSYSISNVCAEATMPKVLRWVPTEMDERELRNRVKNKMIRPTTIPQTRESLLFEQAVAREALRLAFAQHREFATGLKGVQKQRTVGDLFAQDGGADSLVDPMRMDLLIASGGVLSHAPRMEQTAAMLVDSFEPEGFTTLAKDSIFMMPHLGVLASVHPEAAMHVFERDCLVILGTCVAARGDAKWGKPCFAWKLAAKSGPRQGTLACGEIARVPLPLGETAELEVVPEKGFDVGGGPGKPVRRPVKGGEVGLVLDARGRPLTLPENRDECRAIVDRWSKALNLHGSD